MPEQLQDVVILPGGRVAYVPVMPENQTATWTHVLLAVADATEEGQKTAKE